MNNKHIYTFKADYNTCKVLDEDFVSFNDDCFARGIDYDVHITDKGGNGFVPINMAISMFINDCRKEKENRCMANPYRDEHFGEYLKEFVEDFLVYYFNRSTMMNDGNHYMFEVFKGSFVCKVYVPKDEISKEVYDEYMGLGSDFLMGAKGMNTNVLFHYVLPSYYCNLIYDDLTDNDKYLNLTEYRVGLA